MFKAEKGFSSYTADDLQKAKKFYGSMLGFKTADVPDMPELLSLQTGDGTRIFIYTRPGHQPANFTVFNMEVNNIDEVVDELTAKGVTFEQYNDPIKTDAKGIFREKDMAVAWFKDPAGNILSLIQSFEAA